MISRLSHYLLAWIACQAVFACAENNSIVTVPVEFQFAGAEFQRDWIYFSADSSLLAGWSFEPDKAEVVDGTLRMQFCIPETSLRDNKEIKLTIASRAKSLVPRPVEWLGEGSNRHGTMATIRLLEQPDPDWVALKSIRVIQASEEAGASLLELTVVNFTSADSLFDSLVLSAGGSWDGSMCAASPPYTQQTFLNFSSESSTAKSEESWTMLGENKVVVPVTVVERCGQTPQMSAVIPIQTQIAPKSAGRIVLKLLNSNEETNNEVRSGNQNQIGLYQSPSKKKGASAKGDLPSDAKNTWWKFWPDLTVAVSGSDTYPRSISIGKPGLSRPHLLRPHLLRPPLPRLPKPIGPG